jgi:orotate phosphoribosyltransferase
MNQALDLLKKTGAVITNSHFVGTSGKHFATYINKDALYPHTAETSEVCKMLAEKVKSLDIEVVVGPALGGIILSTWTAHHLSNIKQKDVLGIYTEKTPEGNMKLTRGYDQLAKNKKCLIVEDLTTTGGSVKKVINAVTEMGAEVVGIIVMVNKNPKEVNTKFFGTPFFSLDELEIPVYDEQNCELCKTGVPINTSIGHGKKYLEAKGLL